jgi:peroxiredoxin
MKQWMMAAAVLCVAFPAWADDIAAVDQPAPMFRLPAYNAKALGGITGVGLDRYVGPDATEKDVKVVLLSFMASYCGPCKKEMPFLQSLHERYKDFGLRVVMVSIDTEEEGMKKLDELIAANKVTFPVLKDRFNLTARRWLGAQSPLPSVFLIRPDGTISLVHRGYNEDATKLFAEEVEAALGMKRGPASKPAAPATAGKPTP